MGSCVWLAAESERPSIKTILPLFTTQECYYTWMDRGVPYLKDMLFWSISHSEREARSFTHKRVDNILRTLPVHGMDSALTGKKIATFQDYLNHPLRGDFWIQRSVRRVGISIPALLIGGWFDGFVQGS